MIAPDRFALTIHPIPGVDQRISRIAAEHAQTGEVTTAGSCSLATGTPMTRCSRSCSN